jgi:hypothetical protein
MIKNEPENKDCDANYIESKHHKGEEEEEEEEQIRKVSSDILVSLSFVFV